MSELDVLIQDIITETSGTKKEKLGNLVVEALKVLDNKIDRNEYRRKTGRVDI